MDYSNKKGAAVIPERSPPGAAVNRLLPKVFKTEGDVSTFDPSKIFDSLLKETEMSEENAQRITELTVRRIISSGMEFLSGPHIREIVCSVLSEQRFEQERKLYTRIGMPLMDYEEILDYGPKNKSGELINPEKIHHWAADQLAEEYTLLRILNDEESKAHLYGDIHLHKLKYFDLRPLSQTWDPRMILEYGVPPISDWSHCCRSGPAEDLRTAVHHLVEWLGMVQGEFSGDQGFNFISTFLAPYARGLTDHEIKLGMKRFVLEINQLASIIGRNIPVTSISYSPDVLNVLSKIKAIGPDGNDMGTYGDYREENMRLFKILTDTFIEGDYYGNSFRYPKQIVYIKSEWLKNYNDAYSKIWDEIKLRDGLYIINLCSNWLNNEVQSHYTDETIHNFGTLQNISLNLPRYSYLGKDEDSFVEILQEKMNLCSNIFEKKHQIIKKRLKSKHLPLCSSFINKDKALFDLKNQNYAFNIVGLNEAIKYLSNYELHENPDAFNLGKKIIERIKNYCEELTQENNKKFVLQENFSTKVPYRFAMLDLKHFPKLAIPQSNNKGKLFYTNSVHFNKEAALTLLDQINKQGIFHNITQNGRHTMQISLKQLLNQNLPELIKIVCEDSDIACLQFIA